MDSVQCVLADGTTVEHKVSECLIALPQGRRHTPVMLGEKGATALLGVTHSKFSGGYSIPSRVDYKRCG